MADRANFGKYFAKHTSPPSGGAGCSGEGGGDAHSGDEGGSDARGGGGDARVAVGSTYPRPHSLTFIARIAAMMSRGAFALTLRLHVRCSGWVFFARSFSGC